MDHTINRTKNSSNDRVLVLKTKEGASRPALFSSGNTLHAIMEPSGMWKLQYDNGVLPDQLKSRFTSFNKLMPFVTAYFARRNIEITEVIY